MPLYPIPFRFNRWPTTRAHTFLHMTIYVEIGTLPHRNDCDMTLTKWKKIAQCSRQWDCTLQKVRIFIHCSPAQKGFHYGAVIAVKIIRILCGKQTQCRGTRWESPKQTLHGIHRNCCSYAESPGWYISRHGIWKLKLSIYRTQNKQICSSPQDLPRDICARPRDIFQQERAPLCKRGAA